MAAYIDAWTRQYGLSHWRSSRPDQPQRLGTQGTGQLLDDVNLGAVAHDLSRGHLSLTEATAHYARGLDVHCWPICYIAARSATWARSAIQSPETTLPGLFVNRDHSFPSLGVLAIHLPPELAFLNALAEQTTVAAVTAPEAPVHRPIPQPVQALLADVPQLIRLNPEDRLRYGSGIRVGVLDTGIDPEHGDFGRLDLGNCRNFTHEDDIVDRDGHGTHVAGIIAGDGSWSGGRYCGVAPNASLIIAKVLDGSGSGTTASVLRGLEWLVSQGVDVINISLGQKWTRYGSLSYHDGV